MVTWKGRLIAERYAPGITAQTPLESWSMGKSVTATLMGVLIQQGVYELWQPAPIPEWQEGNDLRSEIRIADLLHMSSGLRIKAPEDPDYDPAGTYPDHLYLYTGGVNSFHYAATRPLQWLPGKVGRYRNTDPVLTNYLIRLAVEKRGEEYLSFPRRALFDKLGMRTMVMETDPFGNFLTQGYDFASARDWARLGNLYLQDGVWNGERILPEGFVKFVSTLAPAWVADHRPVYGGFFWINGDGAYPVPRRRVLHVRRGRPEDDDHPVARPRRRAAGALQRRGRGQEELQEGARAADGGSSCQQVSRNNHGARCCVSALGISLSATTGGVASFTLWSSQNVRCLARTQARHWNFGR